MRRGTFTFRLSISILLIISILFSFKGIHRIRVRRDSVPEQEQQYVTEANYSSIYIYRAYFDDRLIVGTVRISLISKCFSPNDTFVMRYDDKTLPLTAKAVEGSCPWSWAKQCDWNAHHLLSPRLEGKVPRKITVIFSDDRYVEVDVERRPMLMKNRLQESFLVCVPPLYWYHDWPRMILFFELWKKHSPTFIIYANSYSKNVGKVLMHYHKKGIIKLVNWPLLETSVDGVDPNAGIYRLSHSLAHNDCVMRMEAEYGVLLDIDEYIHIRGNDTLLNFAKKQFNNNSKIGSLVFKHHGLKITPMDASFDGVSRAVIVNATAPTKVVFKPTFVKYLSTHWVNVHYPYGMRGKQVPVEQGLLLHNRVQFRKDQLKNAIETAITDLDMTELEQRAKKSCQEIFGDISPKHNPNVSLVMDKCDLSWRSQGCKVPLLHCKKALEETDDWVFRPSSEDSYYTRL